MDLLNLPSYLTASILSSLLEVHIVAKLDTAMCSHLHCQPFLAVLSSPEVVLDRTGSETRTAYG
jgi:hypothetical protein